MFTHVEESEREKERGREGGSHAEKKILSQYLVSKSFLFCWHQCFEDSSETTAPKEAITMPENTNQLQALTGNLKDASLKVRQKYSKPYTDNKVFVNMCCCRRSGNYNVCH